MKQKIQIDPFRHEVMHTIASRIPSTIVAHIDKVSRRQMRSRSDIVRSMLVAHLIDQGVVEPLESE